MEAPDFTFLTPIKPGQEAAIRRWVDALRTDSYQQGRSVLRSLENRYCCLGVLCDLTNPEGWAMEVRRVANDLGFEHELAASDWDGEQREGKNIFFPSLALQERIGLTGKGAEYLAEINDEGRSFEMIADFIEGELNAALARQRQEVA